MKQLEQLLLNLNALDMRKKIALGVSFVMAIAMVALFASILNKPATLPLYSNLTREDLNSISRVLAESNIPFVISPDGGTVEVAPGFTANARMILAEQGLPSSQESGYELFDRMNTLGLTSFMQDVTNKRAIEGELARTIQMINGVNSARVHLVFQEKNIYRRNLSGAPTASVVLKTSGGVAPKTVNSIRHMVAASVPGLDSGNVTIVGANGVLMSSREDDAIGGTTRLVELEREFETEAQSKIVSALEAHLGAENFRVTVSARLNNDKKRVDETKFDPESRVERSVQVAREIGTSENKETATPTTIEQNLPDENGLPGSGQSSLENSERREELTNYEINQQKISIVSDGYAIEAMSVALVVNKTRIEALLGENADTALIEAKINELETIARSAVAASEDRGDKINVSLVEFLPVSETEGTASEGGVLSMIAPYMGSMLNTLGMMGAALILVFMGIRPLLSFLKEDNAGDDQQGLLADENGSGIDGVELAELAAPGNTDVTSTSTELAETNIGFDLGALVDRETRIRENLKEMVDENDERAAMAIKQWLREEGKVAA